MVEWNRKNNPNPICKWNGETSWRSVETQNSWGNSRSNFLYCKSRRTNEKQARIHLSSMDFRIWQKYFRKFRNICTGGRDLKTTEGNLWSKNGSRRRKHAKTWGQTRRLLWTNTPRKRTHRRRRIQSFFIKNDSVDYSILLQLRTFHGIYDSWRRTAQHHPTQPKRIPSERWLSSWRQICTHLYSTILSHTLVGIWYDVWKKTSQTSRETYTMV